MTIFLIIFSIFFTFITWRHFEIGIFLFFLLLPTYVIRFSIFAIPTTLLEIMFSIIFLIWLIKLDIKTILNLKSKIINHKYIFTASAIFLLGTTISIFTSIDTRAALGEWKAFYIEPFILFLILITTFKQNNNITIKQYNNNTSLNTYIIFALLLSGLATSILAIYQHFTGFMVPWAFWENNNTFRVTGWYGFPNGVGLFLAPLVPLTIYLFIELITKLRQDKSKKVKVKSLLIPGLLFLLPFTFTLSTYYAKSTAGLVGIAAGVGLLLLIYKKTRWITIIIGAICLSSFLSLSSFSSIKDELLFQDRSGQIRLSIYSETIDFLTDHPILGAGLASYTEKIKPYHTTVNGEGIEIFHHPHNLFLTIWVNTGLIGLFGFVLLLVTSYKLLITHPNKNILYFLTASLTTILITGLVDSPYIKNDLAMLFWGIIALIIITSYDKNLENKKA